MPRRPRIKLTVIPQHRVQRGVKRGSPVQEKDPVCDDRTQTDFGF